LGADYLIDRSKDKDWSEIIFKLTARRGVDVVVDNVGTTFPLSFRAARKGGRILTVGNTRGPKIEIDNRYIFGKHLSLIGSTMGTWQDFATVMDLIYSGRLHPVLDRSYPLSEAHLAQERLEKGQQMGKITLEIGSV
jgi:NADPH:quinone reductase-like Zn-dependent oxidoreductase